MSSNVTPHYFDTNFLLYGHKHFSHHHTSSYFFCNFESMKSLCFSMASAIKGMVSKNKLRYKEDGFNLDLTYISHNIIAMGYPAETLEGLYRNHIDDVVKMLDEKHKDHYRIYNLCAESTRKYDTSKFHRRVVEKYSFQDHNPPPFSILKPFCEDLHSWLTSDKQNVAAIHCKAGKGRTGLMICAYLVHTGSCRHALYGYTEIKSADQALEYYGRTRTSDSKGVTIPSQKRYVYYYEDLVKRNLEYRPVRLRFTSLILTSLPIYNGGTYTIICDIYQVPKKKIKSFEIEIKKGTKKLIYNLTDDLFFEEDIKFEFFLKKIKNEKLFQFWINTFFVAYGSNTFTTSPCPDCSGEKAILSTRSFLKPINSKIPIQCCDDGSVIDISFLNQLREENLFKDCDCDCIKSDVVMSKLSTQPPIPGDNTINNVTNRPDDNSMLLYCGSNPSPPLPTMNMSASSSSSSSTQSLCRKTREYNTKSPKRQRDDVYLVLPKEMLDKAYKDTSNKNFNDGFKVVLKFSNTVSDLYEYDNSENVNCCYENYSTDTYSDDEDDTFDLENSGGGHTNISDDNNRFAPGRRVFEEIKGETTYL